MGRLTYKMADNIYLKREATYGGISKCLNKLGKLEDIEEEIGCPLEVIFEALKDGIYHNYTDYKYKTKLDKWFIFEMENKIAYLNGKVQIVHRFVRVIDENRNHYDSDNRECCPINEMANSHLVNINIYDFIQWKDYKKTWWLKEDKSE